MTVATTSTQVSGSDWTDLGAGPLLLQAIEGEVRFVVADSKPSNSPVAIGFNLRPEYGPRDINSTSHVWAISLAVSGKATIVTAAVTA
jgi:hypothetical protein